MRGKAIAAGAAAVALLAGAGAAGAAVTSSNSTPTVAQSLAVICSALKQPCQPGPTTTVQVPGPTVTVTASPSSVPTPTASTRPTPSPSPSPIVTPTPTPSSSAPSSTVTGSQINASVTGFTGAGLTLGGLGTVGAITYGTSYNGQTVSGGHYTGTVTINASNFTLDDCAVTPPGADGTYGVHIFGSNDTVKNCAIAPSSSYLMEGVLTEPLATGTQITADDISGAENGISLYQDGSTSITGSYLHDPHSSVAGAHVDGIEFYDGSGVVISGNNITAPINDDVTSCINIAPWGGRKVAGGTITGNYLNGAHPQIVYDSTQGAGISGVVVERNEFGGQNDQYGPNFTDVIDGSSAGLTWPTSGPLVNIFGPTSSKAGQIVSP